MTSTITTEQQQAIIDFLKDKHIPSGLGNRDEACSIAAINLALSGKLTDVIPACMSPVIGRWIIGVQDVMPDGMRNSPEWRRLLPLAAGTGQERERERLDILLDWMWETVLPQLQTLANERGFGVEWSAMLTARTTDAAYAAAEAAYAAAKAAKAAAYAAAEAAKAAKAAADAAASAAAAAYAAAAYAVAATTYAAYAAAAAAAYAAAAYVAAAAADYWRSVDPVSLLRKLVA